MAFELRAAGPQDGDALAAVFGAARRSALAYLPQLHSAAEDRAHFAGEIAHGGTTVAVQDGRVVAFIALREGPDEAEAQLEAWTNYTNSLVAAGAMVSGAPLEGTEQATTVRSRGGELQQTEGPAVDSSEILGGY